MFRKVLFLVIILILSSLFVSAQDATEIDPEANACNEGGSMEGKCNIDFDENGTVDDYEILWAWTCGWYIARYDAGIFAEVPSYCQSLLPSEPIDIVEESGSGSELYCWEEDLGGLFIYPANPDGTKVSGSEGRPAKTTEGYPPCMKEPA
jgi:hypothetical protein